VGQIPAHMRTERVEDVHLAVLTAKDDELGTERRDLVRPAVGEVAEQAEAVPAPRITRGRRAGVDDTDFVAGVGRGTHDTSWSDDCDRGTRRSVSTFPAAAAV